MLNSTRRFRFAPLLLLALVGSGCTKDKSPPVTHVVSSPSALSSPAATLADGRLSESAVDAVGSSDGSDTDASKPDSATEGSTTSIERIDSNTEDYGFGFNARIELQPRFPKGFAGIWTTTTGRRCRNSRNS